MPTTTTTQANYLALSDDELHLLLMAMDTLRKGGVTDEEMGALETKMATLVTALPTPGQTVAQRLAAQSFAITVPIVAEKAVREILQSIVTHLDSYGSSFPTAERSPHKAWAQGAAAAKRHVAWVLDAVVGIEPPMTRDEALREHLSNHAADALAGL